MWIAFAARLGAPPEARRGEASRRFPWEGTKQIRGAQLREGVRPLLSPFLVRANDEDDDGRAL